jgi:hypothetical protein
MREKSSPEMCATLVIFKPLSKVNNHPLGENSPNLVILPTYVQQPFDWLRIPMNALILR